MCVCERERERVQLLKYMDSNTDENINKDV